MISSIFPYTGKKLCGHLIYWNLPTESLPREGKIIPDLLNPEASSSADPREHGDECGRRTVPHLHLHSPPSDSPGPGPGPQHISCQQSLNVLEDFRHHLLLQKSGLYASWVSPGNVLALEGKCHEKQDTGRPRR